MGYSAPTRSLYARVVWFEIDGGPNVTSEGGKIVLGTRLAQSIFNYYNVIIPKSELSESVFQTDLWFTGLKTKSICQIFLYPQDFILFKT